MELEIRRKTKFKKPQEAEKIKKLTAWQRNLMIGKLVGKENDKL